MPPSIAMRTRFSVDAFIERRLDDLGLDLLRDDEHAVDVADDEVAGGDVHAADLDRRAEVVDDRADAGVLRVVAVAEDGEALAEHLHGVAMVPVHDRADGAARLRGRGEDLAPHRGLATGARGEVHLAGLSWSSASVSSPNGLR